MFSSRTDWKLTPNRFTEAHRELMAAGARVLDLTVSNPTRAGLPVDGEAILRALSRPESLDYDPQPKGLPSARQAVARYYREAHEVYGLDPESLILTTSTSEAYSHVFRLLCNAGDEILVAKPSYPLFEFLADLQDVKLAPYPLIYDYGWQIDFPSLNKAVSHRTRAVVVVHPNNPTGSFVSQSEAAALNDFCRAHGLAIVADEVFLDYALDGASRQSFAANEEVLTFTLSGLSKVSALPQMKLAWLAASGPRQLAAEAMARLEIVADTYLSVDAPVQWAAPVLLEQRRNIHALLLDRARGNLEELDRQANGQQACQRLAVEGGWYVVLRVPVTRSDEELAIELLRQAKVMAHPGHFFDFPAEGYLVLSLITPREEFAEGVSRIFGLLNS